MTPDYKQVITTFEYDLDDVSEFHKLKATLYDDEERNDTKDDFNHGNQEEAPLL